jgi:hypothetical protein
MTEEATKPATFHMTLPVEVYNALLLKAAASAKGGKQKTVQQYLRELAEKDISPEA